MAAAPDNGPKASRSAAAEARRQKILARGADRLSSITIGSKKEPSEAVPGALVPKRASKQASISARTILKGSTDPFTTYGNQHSLLKILILRR